MKAIRIHASHWLTLGCAALFAGCGTQAGQSGADAKSADAPAKTAQSSDGAGAKPTAKKVELRILTADQLFASIKKQAGKVVVVDCWSTWCEPCKKEFPHLLKLQEKYGDKLVCISVSLDVDPTSKPEDCQEAVLKFLQKENATIENVLSSTPDEEFYTAVQKELKLKEAPAGVPIVLLFGKDGKLVQRWDSSNLKGEGSFSYAKSVDPEVEKLLKP